MSDKDKDLPSVRSVYGRLWRDWLKTHSRVFVIILTLMVLVALSSAGYAQFIQWIIEAFEASDPYVIYWGPAGAVALSLTKGISQYIQNNLQNTVLVTMQEQMQTQMFDRLLNMDLSSLTNESPAALAARFSSDIAVARSAVTAVLSSIAAFLTIFAAIGYMLLVDALMTVVLIMVFGLAFGPVGIIGARIRNISKRTQREIATMTGAVNEGLSAIRMVRTYRLEDRLRSGAQQVFTNLKRLQMRVVRWQAAASPLVEVTGGIAVAVLLVLVTLRLQAGRIDLAAFVGLLTALGVMTSPARRLGASYAAALQGLAALDRIFTLFDTRNVIEGGDHVFEPNERADGNLRFEDVSFSYPDGYQALSNIDLDVLSGQTVAFVGRSGAGKSTIFNLLPRLYDVTSGRITLDGRDIRDFSFPALRDQISVVSQDSVLLNGSVMDNIRFGRETATDDECRAAAEQAAAAQFIEDLPDGYETIIDPTKQSFSGGERQRLSIARAILRNAPILLLDEPTSALDAESESAIRAALSDLEKGRTTLVIAHRLSTILHADQIIVLDQGQIADKGTHDELLKRDGLYAELFNLQFQQPPRRKRRGRSADEALVARTPLGRLLQYFGG
ncbi:MAG: ABC transporter ATP-binding protein [Pseudomonadota bacterium]